jgi:hypothetical protein
MVGRVRGRALLMTLDSVAGSCGVSTGLLSGRCWFEVPRFGFDRSAEGTAGRFNACGVTLA